MFYAGDEIYGDDVTSGPADGEWREPRYWSSDGKYPMPDQGEDPPAPSQHDERVVGE